MTINKKTQISVLIGNYAIPPLKDMLVMGKHAPIGCIAMRRAIELLVKTPFEHIEIEDDDVISDILIRTSLLKRISKEELISYVIANIKPLMGCDEILHSEMNINVQLSSDGN